MNEQEFLTRVHASEGLRHAVLRAIEVDRASNICTFELVTDLPHTEEDEKAALAAVRAAVPQALRARVRSSSRRSAISSRRPARREN